MKHKLILSADVHQLVHGGGIIGRANTWLAVKITKAVGTMWMAYIFAVIALIGLPTALDQAKTQGPLPIVQWIAQTFLQLVLLSIIIVGQNVIQAANDARAETDHQTLELLRTINQQQLDILTKLNPK